MKGRPVRITDLKAMRTGDEIIVYSPQAECQACARQARVKITTKKIIATDPKTLETTWQTLITKLGE